MSRTVVNTIFWPVMVVVMVLHRSIWYYLAIAVGVVVSLVIAFDPTTQKTLYVVVLYAAGAFVRAVGTWMTPNIVTKADEGTIWEFSVIVQCFIAGLLLGIVFRG